MMTWWFAFAALLCLTAAGVLLLPLARPVPWVRSRSESAAAVLQDKLAQLERDRESGLIGADEARGAQAEISRALIAVSREAESENRAASEHAGGRSGLVLVATIAIVAAVGVYQIKGAFQLPDQPLTLRADAGQPTMASDHEGGAMADAVAALRARLEQQPDNADSWLLLARSYSTLGAFEEAAEAYARVAELRPEVIEFRGDYAEALVRAAGNRISAEAQGIFQSVLERRPDDPRALYYIALYEAQNGEPLAAAQRLVRIIEQAPANASYVPAVRSILEELIADGGLDRGALGVPGQVSATPAPGPTAADIATAAALPQGEQLDMIRGMVARLEERLAEEPGDIDGWLRLARSRMVLGEPGAGVTALERALEENPGNPALQAALDELRSAATQ